MSNWYLKLIRPYCFIRELRKLSLINSNKIYTHYGLKNISSRGNLKEYLYKYNL